MFWLVFFESLLFQLFVELEISIFQFYRMHCIFTYTIFMCVYNIHIYIFFGLWCFSVFLWWYHVRWIFIFLFYLIWQCIDVLLGFCCHFLFDTSCCFCIYMWHLTSCLHCKPVWGRAMPETSLAANKWPNLELRTWTCPLLSYVSWRRFQHPV